MNLKDVCGKEGEVKLEEEVIVDVKDDGSSLLPESIAEEEEKLLKARIQEDEVKCEEAPDLNETQFDKLDELLTQTKLYSEFLLEKMDDITLVCSFFAAILLILCQPFGCVNLYCYFFYFKNGGDKENDAEAEEESNPAVKKKGRGGKRKAASQCNTVSTLCLCGFLLFSCSQQGHCILDYMCT